jgi:fibronectin-binding autotransporter adhesin
MFIRNNGRRIVPYGVAALGLVCFMALAAGSTPASAGYPLPVGSTEYRISSSAPSGSTANVLGTRHSALSNSLRPTINVYCVKADASATGAPCTNPTAITTIQAAVASAVAGDEVRVAYGTYTGSGSAVVTVNAGIAIIGGFPGGTTGWGTSTDAVNTAIDGQGARNTLSVSGATVTVQNFTLNNGGISNTGTINVQTGYSLNIFNAGNCNGTFSIATGGLIVFTGGTTTLAGGTAFTGAGIARTTNATLTMNGAVSAQNFDQTAGTLTGSGTFTVNGTFNWTGGTMDSPTSPNVGITIMASGSALHISGVSATKVLLQRILNISSGATAYMDGSGTGVFYLGNSATVNNSGTFIVQNDDSIVYISGTSPTFSNPGTFRKASGTGITTLGNGFVLLSNSGTIVAQSGTISMDGQSADSGVFSATVGARLRFGGNNHTLGASSHVDVAGTIEFSAGTTFIQGTYNVTGNTVLSGGTVVFGGPANIDTLSIGPNSTYTMGGSGSVINVRVLNWTGGTIDGGPNPNNRGTINVSGSITFGGVNTTKVLLRCTINNNGAAVMNTTGTGIFFMGDAAYFDNRPGATFDIQNDDDVRYINGVQCTFNNEPGATLRKSVGSAGPDYSILGDGFLQFNNGGTVDVQAGMLSLEYSAGTPASVDTGTYNVSSPTARLRFNGPNSTRTLPAGSTITGVGAVEFLAGTVTIAGNYNVTGTTNVTGGTVQFNTNAVTNGGTLGGTGVLSGDAPFTFTINAIFFWNGGTMAGTGTTVVSPAAQLHIGGVNATKVLSNRTLNNNGTIYIDGTGAGTLYLSNAATINNGTAPGSSAFFYIQNNDSILYLSGTNSTFNNNGHLWKSLGAGLSTLSNGNMQFNNYNDVEVLTGTLSLDGGNTNGLNSTGGFTVTTQSNLRFNGGAHTLVASAFIVGAGSVEFSAGTVSMAGRYNIGGTTLVTGGTAQFNSNSVSGNTQLTAGTLSGDAIFTTTNVFNWGGIGGQSNMTGAGISVIPTGAQLHLGGVNAIKVLMNRTVNNNGAAYVDGTGTGTFYLGSGAAFNNNGTMEIRNNDNILYISGSNASFNNNGTLDRTVGTATLILGNSNLQFNNSGTVNVYTGTISLESASAISSLDTGAYNVSSVAALQFNGPAGTRNLTASAAISAAGSVNFNAGTVNINGSYNVRGSGSTNVAGGTVSFNASANSVNVNLSLGSLTGSGTLSTTGTFNWTGGTMDSPSPSVGTTNIVSGTLHIAGTNATRVLTQRTVNNNGTAVMDGTGAGTFYMGNGAHFNNNTSFNIQNNDNIIYLSGADSVFTNNGTFGKSAGNGTSIVGSGNLRFNNNGTVDVLVGVINFAQNFVQTASGNMHLGGGDIRTDGSLSFQGGTLIGTGAITGTVNNSGGTVSPNSLVGTPAGTMIFNGSYTQGTGGAMKVDIGGQTPGIDFDKISFLSRPTFSGTLNISVTNGYSPNVGDRFQVLDYTARTGNFTTLNGTVIAPGKYFVPDAGPPNYALIVQGTQSTPTPTFTPASGTPTPTPIGGCGSFSDVHVEDFFYEPVRYLNCHGVISGYADGTFRPFNLTTRGQLSKIVVLAVGWSLYVPTTPTFRDVPLTHTFFQYVETAYSHNIISGYSCGTGCLEFRPENNVTRAQLCKIVVNAKGWTVITPSTATFRDVPTTDPFFGFIETAYSHNIISGYSCGASCLEFRPGNNATRGQISKIVYLAVTTP